MKRSIGVAALAMSVLATFLHCGGALAASDRTTAGAAVVATPPSVANGVANGVVKPSGSPSVGNGVANGIVKLPGSPSVGNGVANGVVKSSTVEQ